jgi:hypothetical protein
MLADFHNHSCLSPCGSLYQSPRILAETAAIKKLKVLALTDHNSSLNCPAFSFHCRRLGIIPIYGIEVTTQEEVHILTLFANLDAARAFGEYIYSIITPVPNNPEKMGDQVYVDEEDNILGNVEYYLINAVEIGIDALSKKTAEYNGIVIPAHVDRPAFSMTSQLGTVIQGPWAALECISINRFSMSPFNTYNFPLISGSDAHLPEHIGRRPFELDTTTEELMPQGPEKDIDITVLVEVLKKRIVS